MQDYGGLFIVDYFVSDISIVWVYLNPHSCMIEVSFIHINI